MGRGHQKKKIFEMVCFGAFWASWFKPAFHDGDTDILARIVTRMSACRSACHRNNFRKSRVSDVRIGV